MTPAFQVSTRSGGGGDSIRATEQGTAVASRGAPPEPVCGNLLSRKKELFQKSWSSVCSEALSVSFARSPG